VWNEIKGFFGSRPSSRDEAKARLHLVLAHDRTGIDGARLQEMRRALAAVIANYVEIDSEMLEIEVEQTNRHDTQLKVSSPVRIAR